MQRLRQHGLACIAPSTVYSRRWLAYTQSSPQLQIAAEQFRYRSPVWIIPEEDAYWIEPLTLLKSDQVGKHTEAWVPKQVPLFNLDQLDCPVDALSALAVANVPTSYKTKKPYGKTIAQQLVALRKFHGYDSNWWFYAASMNSMPWPPRDKARRHTVVTNMLVRAYNAEQYQNPVAITQQPVSGASRRPFPASMCEPLKNFLAENNFSGSLFFEPKHLQNIQLEPKEEAVPLLLQEKQFFCVDQLKAPGKAYAAAGTLKY